MAPTQASDGDAARLAAAEDVVLTLMKAHLAAQHEAPGDSLWPLEALAQLVRDGDDWEKEEAAGMLRTMARDGAEMQLQIAQAGAVAPLVRLARFGNVRGQREWALRALFALADENAVTKQAIAGDGGIGTLVSGLTDGSAIERELTMWVLSELALKCDENQVAILDAGVANITVDLMRGDSPFRETATTLVRNLSYSSAGTPAARFIESGLLEHLLPIVTGADDDELKELALRSLFSLSTESSETKVAIINSGVIQPLVAIVRDGVDSQKLVAAQTLANLSSWRGEARERVIVDTVAIESLIRMLRNGEDDTKLRMAHVVGNLAYAAFENKMTLARTGVIGPLVHLIRVGNDDQKSRSMMAIGNLAHNHLPNQNTIAAAGIVPLVTESLRTGSDELKKRAADVLGDIVSKHSANQITVASKEGVTEALVGMLREDDEKSQEPAARALGKLSRGNAAIQGKIVSDGAIGELVRLLNSPSNDISKYAARALGALASDLDAHRISVAQAGAITPLVRLFRDGTDKQKRAAAKALDNLASIAALQAEVLQAGGDSVVLELSQVVAVQ